MSLIVAADRRGLGREAAAKRGYTRPSLGRGSTRKKKCACGAGPQKPTEQKTLAKTRNSVTCVVRSCKEAVFRACSIGRHTVSSGLLPLPVPPVAAIGKRCPSSHVETLVARRKAILDTRSSSNLTYWPPHSDPRSCKWQPYPRQLTKSKWSAIPVSV